MQINSGWYLYSFFGGAGLHVDYDGTTNTLAWNNATGLEVAKSVINMANHSGFVNYTDDELKAQLQAGKISAAINGTWNATLVQQVFGDNYAATKLPTYTLNGQQVQMNSFAGYKYAGVNKTSANTYWAMKLAEFITAEAAQLRRFELRQIGPSNVKAAQSPAVLANPAIAALSQQSAYSVIQYVGDKYWTPTEAFGNQIATKVLNTSTETSVIQEALDLLVQGVQGNTVS